MLALLTRLTQWATALRGGSILIVRNPWYVYTEFVFRRKERSRYVPYRFAGTRALLSPAIQEEARPRAATLSGPGKIEKRGFGCRIGCT
jgi:hypothetical protein